MGLTVTGYVVQISTNGGTSWSTLTTKTTSVDKNYVATGLESGSTYSFHIAFYYVTGTSASTTLSSYSDTASATTLKLPDPPTSVMATLSGSTATITWTASTSTGVTGYNVAVSPGSQSCSTTTTTCTIANLPAGTYTFSVVATSDWGSSGSATSSSVSVSGSTTTARSPGAPLIAVSSPITGEMIISLKAPVNSGAKPITSYQYSLSGGPWKSIAKQKNGTFIVLKLISRKTYSVRLRAVSAVGSGNSSSTIQVKIK